MYVGSNSGLEQAFCEEQNIPFKSVATGKLRRYFSLQNIVDWFKLPLGIMQSLRIVREFKPDVIFSKGGYVAVPVVLAGGILRKKIVTHESDFTPGLATRISSIFAAQICVPTEKTKSFFQKRLREKVVVTGNPIRKEILKGTRKGSEKFLKAKTTSPVLLVMGGSTGAQKLNELIWNSLPELTKEFTVIHATGKGKNSGGKKSKKYFEFEYIGKELKDIYAITDLVVCRSGAGTVSEINALGLPAIYMPLSSGASRGDQFENATHVSATPHIILNDFKVTPDEFVKEVQDFYKKNKDKKKQDKNSLKAAEMISEVILK